jgi:pyridoxal phosphate enzyme (YggS family)
MENASQRIADNVLQIRVRMAAAAVSAGRSPDEIQLVAVSKYVGIPQAAALIAAGCSILAESRPQQLWEKASAPELAVVRWHLVGHLQRNKVRRTLTLVEMIHSIDSWRLLEEIDRSAAEIGCTPQVLLEVNCSGDSSKHGLSADGLRQLLADLPQLKHVRVRGLMTMAALEGGETVAEQNFATLRELRDSVQRECPPGVELTELSMGMSHDFEAAIRQGATLVRIGSLLFAGVES